MKIKKKLVAAMATCVAISCTSISALADVDSDMNNLIVPIKIESVDINTVNGFIAEVKYNPDDLVPVLCDNDLLGDDCYAERIVDKGYLTADKINEGTISVGWADKDSYDLSNGNVMANLRFKTNSDANNETTAINTKIYSLAKYSDAMYENEVEYSENYSIKRNSFSSDIVDTVESGDAVEIVDSTDVYNPDIIALPGVPPTNKE